MLNSITCDTPISSLLQISDVESYLDSFEGVLNSYQTSVIDGTLTQEMTTGGLAETNAFTMNGEAVLYNDAQEIENVFYQAKSSINSFKSQIIESATVQRNEEIKKLKIEVEKKITILESEIGNLNKSIIAKPSTIIENIDTINKLKEQLKIYKDKYQDVCSLK